MKYIIKCSYCDKTYTVNVSGKETDFICTSCGGANGMDNVVKQIAVLGKLSNKGNKDPIFEADLNTIKSFEVKEHKVKSPLPGVILTLAVLVILGALLIWVGMPAICLIFLLPLGLVYLYNYYSRDMPDMPTLKDIENNLKEERENLEDEMNPWYSEMQHEDEFTRNFLNEFDSDSREKYD